MEAAPHPWPALGVLLMRDGLVEKEELEEILAEQRDSKQQRVSGRRLGEVLIQRGRVTPSQVAKLVAEQYELPFVDFDVADVDLRVATIMREDDARRFWAIPISRGGDGTLLLAIADPSTVLFSDELRRLLGSVPRFAVVGPDAIERAITFVYRQPLQSIAVAPEPAATADDLIIVTPDDAPVPAEAEVAHSDPPALTQSWPPLGALLLRDGLVTHDDLETALAQQRLAPSLRLGEILSGKGLVPRGAIARLVAEQYELPFFELDRVEIDPEVARRLPEEIAWRSKAVPIAEHEDGSLDVAIADPTSAVYSDELHQALAVPLTFVVAAPDDIEAALDLVHEPNFEPQAEQPDPGPDEEEIVPDMTGDGALEVTEPAHLVFDASMSDVLDPPAEEGEASPPTHLELVEEIASADDAEPAEHESAELSWAPVAEIVYPVEADDESTVTETAEAEIVELARPEEPQFDEAEVYEFSWPTEPVETSDEPSLENDLAMQVAEAMIADVVENPLFDDEEDTSAAESVTFDIFGITSRPVESAATHEDAVFEDYEDGLATASLAYVPPLPEHVEDDTSNLDAEPVAFETELDPETVEVEPDPAPEELTEVELQLAGETTRFDTDQVAYETALDTDSEPEVAYDLGPETEPTPQELDDVELLITDETAAFAAEQTAHDSEHAMETVAFEIEAETEPAPQEPGDVDRELADEAATFEIEPAAPEVEPVFFWDREEPADVEPQLAEDVELQLAEDVELQLAEDVELQLADEADVRTSGFDALTADALAAGASAFHFSPHGDELAVRARVDGLVRDLGTATPDERDALVERLEAEGIGRTHVVATSRGTKTTLFVRERAGAPTSLEDLGLASAATRALRAALERPTGAILVCGPAGSGTTTTLYAALEAISTPERIVATIEHPVERLLDGVDQIEVAPSAGVTFVEALRDLRFTDTDAVLVSELEDRESASLALSTAYEGRLVVAGFHAPGATAAIVRLANIGVEPTALASSLGCVVSQRLVRTVCTDCRETYYASEDELAALDQPEGGSPRLLVRGTGCSSCAGTGFRGRTAIFEVMPITDDLRGLIADGASAKKLQKAGVAAGMRTLRDEGIRLCLDGVTTVDEVARVLGDDA